MAAESDPVLSDRRGDVAVVTLNRPAAYNAVGTQLLTQLGAVLDTCSADVRAIVLAAEGQHFCVGADLVEVTSAFGNEDRIRSFLMLFHRIADAIAASPVPVIAAVQGLALAGGLELALACDLIVAADNAEFGDQHINVGLIPGGGGLPAIAPRDRAAAVVGASAHGRPDRCTTRLVVGTCTAFTRRPLCWRTRSSSRRGSRPKVERRWVACAI